MPKQSELTQEAWHALLAFLGGTEEAAGAKYEVIRRRLVRIFVCRGSSHPEELADVVIDRVALKCNTIADSYVGDPALYFAGVARKVFLESVKKRPFVPPMPEPDPPEVKEAMADCLDQCMKELKKQDQVLILDYYRGEGRSRIHRRKDLAALLGKSLNALRIKVFRIHRKLEACTSACADRKGIFRNGSQYFRIDG